MQNIEIQDLFSKIVEDESYTVKFYQNVNGTPEPVNRVPSDILRKVAKLGRNKSRTVLDAISKEDGITYKVLILPLQDQ